MKIITLLRKPLDGSVAENILNHGCGGLNIEGCRVGEGEERANRIPKGVKREGSQVTSYAMGSAINLGTTSQGRWPANFILSHSEGCDLDCIGGCPIKEMDTQSGDASRYFMQFQQERKD